VKDKVVRAMEFAAKAHEGQKYGEQPYTGHLSAVHMYVAWETEDQDAKAAAWLHDVPEDTNVTLEEIGNEFGQRVASIVQLCTDPPGKNRKEKKAKSHAKLRGIDRNDETGAFALLVKTADRLANVQNCITTRNKGLLKMYRKEHGEFRKSVECHRWRSLQQRLNTTISGNR
jgi:(p)ppGpp synthase/HD superfamily hydrolase